MGSQPRPPARPPPLARPPAHSPPTATTPNHARTRTTPARQPPANPARARTTTPPANPSTTTPGRQRWFRTGRLLAWTAHANEPGRDRARGGTLRTLCLVSAGWPTSRQAVPAGCWSFGQDCLGAVLSDSPVPVRIPLRQAPTAGRRGGRGPAGSGSSANTGASQQKAAGHDFVVEPSVRRDGLVAAAAETQRSQRGGEARGLVAARPRILAIQDRAAAQDACWPTSGGQNAARATRATGDQRGGS